MVLMNAAKAARNEASIVNRTNICGGPKKAGTAPSQGWFMQSWQGMLPRAPQTIPRVCIPSRTIQTQVYGYRATIGGNNG